MGSPATPNKIVLSGATGFLGGVLARRLTEAGISVVPVVRTRGSLPDEIVISSETDLVDQVIACEPDAIIHVAATGGVSSTVGEFGDVVQANITLGSLLLHASAELNARFVTTGSFSQRSLRPNDRVGPSSFYAASKTALESVADYYCNDVGLEAVCLQLTDVYGPEDTRNRLLTLLAEATASGESLGVTAGEQIVSFVHVDDVIDAIVHSLTCELPDGGPALYSVSGPEVASLRDTVASIEKALGVTVPVVWGARPYRSNEVMKPALLDPPPGWVPTRSVTAGFKQLLEAAQR